MFVFFDILQVKWVHCTHLHSPGCVPNVKFPPSGSDHVIEHQALTGIFT